MLTKYQNVFRSRYKALAWAAGVLLTAYCSVPDPDPGAETLVAAPQKHINPWAIDPPGQ